MPKAEDDDMMVNILSRKYRGGKMLLEHTEGFIEQRRKQRKTTFTQEDYEQQCEQVKSVHERQQQELLAAELQAHEGPTFPEMDRSNESHTVQQIMDNLDSQMARGLNPNATVWKPMLQPTEIPRGIQPGVTQRRTVEEDIFSCPILAELRSQKAEEIAEMRRRDANFMVETQHAITERFNIATPAGARSYADTMSTNSFEMVSDTGESTATGDGFGLVKSLGGPRVSTPSGMHATPR
jgi:hypothetical protein